MIAWLISAVDRIHGHRMLRREPENPIAKRTEPRGVNPLARLANRAPTFIVARTAGIGDAAIVGPPRAGYRRACWRRPPLHLDLEPGAEPAPRAGLERRQDDLTLDRDTRVGADVTRSASNEAAPACRCRP